MSGLLKLFHHCDVDPEVDNFPRLAESGLAALLAVAGRADSNWVPATVRAVWAKEVTAAKNNIDKLPKAYYAMFEFEDCAIGGEAEVLLDQAWRSSWKRGGGVGGGEEGAWLQHKENAFRRMHFREKLGLLPNLSIRKQCVMDAVARTADFFRSMGLMTLTVASASGGGEGEGSKMTSCSA